MSFDSEAIAAASRLVKGARVYIEGSLKLDQWTAQDGTEKHGLPVFSWYSRLAAIGKNKPKRERNDAGQSASKPPANHFHSDEIPF